MDHVLSEFSTMTHTSWVTFYGMAHSFIELHKVVIHAIILASFFCDCGFCSGGCGIIVLASSVFPLMDEDKRLVQVS